MLSSINTGLRFLGCGLLVTFVVSIADSLWTGTMICPGCDSPMLIIEDMQFHSIKIRVYECAGCGAHDVRHLRANGTDWTPGVPSAYRPAGPDHTRTAEIAAPVNRTPA